MKKRMMAFLMSLTVGLVMTIRPAFAEEEGGACREDVKKLCGDVTPGAGAIHDCMKAHEPELSEPCKHTMAKGQQRLEERGKELQAACQADIKRYCANVTPGEGRQIACLRAYDDKISAGCKEILRKPMRYGKRSHGGKKHDGNISPSSQAHEDDIDMK